MALTVGPTRGGEGAGFGKSTPCGLVSDVTNSPIDLEVAVDYGRPIFVQIAEQFEGQILDGTMHEESQVPSINRLAAFRAD